MEGCEHAWRGEGWLSKWMEGRKDEGMEGCEHAWRGEGWLSRWMEGRKDGGMDGWRDVNMPGEERDG